MRDREIKRCRKRRVLRKWMTGSLCALLILLLYALGKRFVFPKVERNVTDVIPVLAQSLYTEPVIDIQRVEMGEGQEKITYFVSDIQVGDATDLRAAFANNQYGLNIREPLSAMAQAHEACFAVNGDYYGFRSDGIVIRNGELYRDEPTDRECLVMYRDGTAETLCEKSVTGTELVEKGAWNVFSFGPVLMEDGVIREGLDASYKVDSFNADISDKQPRTGIGIVGKNHYLIISVDGRAEGYSCGMTFQEFAALFAEYGCETAYNLDGGSSVTLYRNGEILNRPSSGGEREISDIIYISGHSEANG